MYDFLTVYKSASFEISVVYTCISFIRLQEEKVCHVLSYAVDNELEILLNLFTDMLPGTKPGRRIMEHRKPVT